MPVVFLSYARADADLADKVQSGLGALSIETWIDKQMPGVDWVAALRSKIDEVAAVVVLWTPASINSQWVQAEAQIGMDKHKLVNAMADIAAPPWPYGQLNALPLDGWTPGQHHTGWRRLIETIEAKAVAAGLTKPGAYLATLVRREQLIDGRRAALDDAEQAFQAAQRRHGKATAALDKARLRRAAADNVAASMKQVDGVAASIVFAAEKELAEASEQLDASEREDSDAESTLAEASRRYAAAKLALDAAASDPLPAAEDMPTSVAASLRSDLSSGAGAPVAEAARAADPAPAEPPKAAEPPKRPAAAVAGARSVALPAAENAAGAKPAPARVASARAGGSDRSRKVLGVLALAASGILFLPATMSLLGANQAGPGLFLLAMTVASGATGVWLVK